MASISQNQSAEASAKFWNRRSLRKLFEDRGLEARLENYWLHYPRSYVEQRFARQFGFPPFFLALYPGDLIPIPSIDVLLGIFEKPAVRR